MAIVEDPERQRALDYKPPNPSRPAPAPAATAAAPSTPAADLPLPARDIFLDLAITNPGGDADSTTVVAAQAPLTPVAPGSETSSAEAGRGVRMLCGLRAHGPQRGEHAVGPLLVVELRLFRGMRVVQRPVHRVELPAVAFEHAHGCRRDLAHAVEDGAWRRNHGVEAHVVVQRNAVDRSVDLACGEKRRQRGGKTQASTGLAVVHRLDAETVARQRQPAALALVHDVVLARSQPLDQRRLWIAGAAA